MMNNDQFTSATEARQFLENFCDQELTVHVTDGRKYVGCFLCTDNTANIVMGQCLEYPSPSDSCFDNVKRHLSTVVIPGQYIVKIECKSELINRFS